MRVRVIGLTACLLLLSALAGLAGAPGDARARLQEATPQPEEAATPTPAPVEVVTLVAWYTPDPSGEFLQIGPLRTNQNLVAGPGEVGDRVLTGTADFDDPDNDELPRIKLGESIFDAYPVYAEDPASVYRWIFFNDEPGLRPGTLVMQIEAIAGPYTGSLGTATWVSRAPEAGGVLIIVLNPPEE